MRTEQTYSLLPLTTTMSHTTNLVNVTEMTKETSYDYYETIGSNPTEGPGSQDAKDYTLAIFYALTFVFSLGINILVLVIIYLFEKLTTVTNLLLLNLVLSSLLFIISLPFGAAYELLKHWPFGNSMCKLVASLFYLGFYSSGLFLTVLTFDRHLAVVYALNVHRIRSRAYAVVSCAVVWILSALACIKPMILYKARTNQQKESTFCEESAHGEYDRLISNAGFYTQLILFFLFPLLITTYCYARITCTVLASNIASKFKTVRLIFIIVLLFYICWTPFNVAMLMYEKASTPVERDYWREVLNATYKVAHLYFCISPIFYTFVGKKFQNYFRILLVRRFPRLKHHISVSQGSRTNISTKSTNNDL